MSLFCSLTRQDAHPDQPTGVEGGEKGGAADKAFTLEEVGKDFLGSQLA